MKNKPRAISLLSSGLDSTVATILMSHDYQIHAITFDYGQRSSKMEIKSSKSICERLGIEHTVIELPWLGKIGSSALTTTEDVPLLEMEELEDTKRCEDTALKVWVPGRNTIFTAIAMAYAEAENADKIIVGWDLEEAETFPDNSKEYLEAFNQVLRIGSFRDVEIIAPLIDLKKNDIVSLGLDIQAPLELSYSCYLGNEKHCGQCESCLRRKRAFKEANVKDDTIYMD